MKPSPLRIHRPTTVDETLDLLAARGDTGKILAGGQSLVPVLNMRLAAPSDLFDITSVVGIDELEVSDADGSEEICVGASVTHRRVERSAEVTRANPLLGEALRFVAHPAVRNRGTTVGSIAHADPNGEMPMVLALTGGRIEARSRRGERTLGAEELNIGPLETSLESDELITRAIFPALSAGSRTGFDELARRSGDYALAGVGMILDVDGETVTGLRCGFVSVTDVPDILDLGEAVSGARLSDASEVAATVAEAARDFIDPGGDIHASADYRRHLAGVIASRLFRRLCRSDGASGRGTAADSRGEDSPVVTTGDDTERRRA
ncbi:FAD binding domain-containing protein [Brevibacterium renqingii]|uniref:FAD binding domain-containing protein n=1 Tax=Brevibacterium renqingii TaxID=2776916 RepID=UPI001ADF5B9A|nr:FAD binding domain-containing protein [Brevibacterium renqingii]